MFIDNLALMLVNLVAGLFLLAYYIFRGLDDPNQRHWTPGFTIVGLVAIVTGLHMIFVWPLPGSFNIAFGAATVFFGAIFIGAALALALGWSLLTVAIYALFAGLSAIIIGARIIDLGLTRSPVVSGIAFVLAGLAGVLLWPVLYLRDNRIARIIYAIIALIAALMFAIIGYEAFWGHLAEFSEWVPSTLRR